VIDALTTDSPATKRSASEQSQLIGAYAALLLFMFIYYARPEDWIPGLSAVPLAKISGIVALLALLFSFSKIPQLPRETLYLAILIGQLLLSAALSPVWRGGAFQATLEFAKVLMAIVVTAAAVNTPRRLRLLVFTQAASVAAIASITLWKGHSLEGRFNGFLRGDYGDSNTLALIQVISLPLCLALLMLTRSWIWKAAWTSAIVVMTLLIILTGSRGGFLAFIVTIAVGLWQFAVRGRRSYLIVLAAVLGAIGLQYSGGMLLARFKGTFNSEEVTAEAYSSSQQRQQLFWRSVEITEEHPLFGVGPGNFAQLSGSWHVAHNAFTQMSSEAGIPALILYLLILSSGFKNIRMAKRFANRPRETTLLANALQASLAGYVVGSWFLSVSFSFFPYFLVANTTALLWITKKSVVRSAPDTVDGQGIPDENNHGTNTRPEISWQSFRKVCLALPQS
jgi:O-antigen ligase